MMISKAHMVWGVQLEVWVSPLALASVHNRAGVNRRNCPLSLLLPEAELQKERGEQTEAMIPEEGSNRRSPKTPYLAFQAPLQCCSLLSGPMLISLDWSIFYDPPMHA